MQPALAYFFGSAQPYSIDFAQILVHLRFFDVVGLALGWLVGVLEQVRVVAEPQEAGPGGHEGQVDSETLVGHVPEKIWREF